jgi:hypothetical protein
MERMIAVGLLILAGSLLAASPAVDPDGGQEPPSRVRGLEKWTVDYAPGPMRLYRDTASDTLYWYATFTLTNRTGQDRRLAPRWELLDEEGRLVPAGQGVDSDVTRAILKLLNDPQLEETSAIIGEIGQGVEMAKTGLVVFPAGPEARKFAVLVSGLSSERGTLKDPATGQELVARKTLCIDYHLPGERSALSGPVPLAEPPSGTANPRWIMR